MENTELWIGHFYSKFYWQYLVDFEKLHEIRVFVVKRLSEDKDGWCETFKEQVSPDFQYMVFSSG
jgi:hypothetical protein